VRRAALLALAAAALAACGGEGAADHPLSGKIGGRDWTYVAGETSAVLSTDDSFWADVYDVPIEARCFGLTPSGATNGLILTVPRSRGNHPLGAALEQTFYVDSATGGDNLATSDGFIDVTALTATTLRGHASFTYDAANTVSGTFEIAICR